MNKASLLPGEPAIRVTRDVEATMRDGTLLRADIYQPHEAGPLPVLLLRTPYPKTGAQSDYAYAHPSWYAAKGYVVIVQDTRGCGNSDGEFTPFLNEAEDGFDTIAWAARVPGADGRIATYGFSYAGFNQLQAAALQPPNLVAIAPALAPSQAYDGCLYHNGAPALDFMTFWAAQLALAAALRRGDADLAGRLAAALAAPDQLSAALPIRSHPLLSREIAPYFHDWLDHPTDGAFWRPWNIEERYGDVAVPALHIAGQYDLFLKGSIRNFRGLRDQAANEAVRSAQKLVLAPIGHMPWAPIQGAGSDGGPNALDDWHVRWFGHHLKGVRNGVLDRPVSTYVTGAGWRDLDDWPSPTQHLHLSSDGRANSAAGDGRLLADPPGSEPVDRFIYNPLNPVLSKGGHGLTPEWMGPRSQDDAAASKAVLSYTSDPMPNPGNLVGDAEITLFATSSADDTDFTARLLQVLPDGTSVNLAEGVIRTAYRRTLGRPEPIVPDTIERYVIPLGALSFRITAGARLRLLISSSDFPLFGRNLNTGNIGDQDAITDTKIALQTVFHDDRNQSFLAINFNQRDE